MKKQVYITGHRNPDLDSVCAAYAYAQLKNAVDSSRNYHAIRCGHLSANVRRQLELVGIDIPPYMRDVFPKVRDVMLPPEGGLEASAPIYDLVRTYKMKKPSVVPVFENGEYFGLLSVDDITAWFLRDNSDLNPVYEFTMENIGRVIPGKVIHKGKKTEFSGTLLAGAAAFEDFCEFLDKDESSVVVMGMRTEHIRQAVLKNVPAIILTAVKSVPDMDFSGYDGTVYMTSLGTAETLRRMRMAQPLRTIMGKQEEAVQAADLFEDAKEMFLSSHARGFAVMDGDNFAGFVTRRCFLKTPSNNVIMVDHNEREQSIRGIESANILEIIDHHRLNALKTELPILIDAEPVGSTCTIVFDQFSRAGLTPDILTAKAMLTGILADTLILKSPTTTEKDISAVKILADICSLDVKKYGQELLSVTERLASADPASAIKADFKKYENGGIKLGIGQCEVTTLKDVCEYAGRYLEELEAVRREAGLDWAVLMITDVLIEHSILLTTEYKAVKKLPYSRLESGILDMPNVMSRKKQLLPVILHSMEM